MDPIEILKSVDEFYNSAWNKLIIFTSILVAVVGVIIPILLTWWQNRTLKIREDAIQKELNSSLTITIKNIEEKLTNRINEEFDNKIEKIKSEMNQEVANIRAGTFHLQGNNNLKEKLYKLAIIDFFTAGENYLEGKDLLNLGRINNLIKNNLGKLSKEELEELESENSEPSDYINKLEDSNENEVFTDLIRELKMSITKIKKTPVNNV